MEDVGMNLITEAEIHSVRFQSLYCTKCYLHTYECESQCNTGQPVGQHKLDCDALPDLMTPAIYLNTLWKHLTPGSAGLNKSFQINK